MKKNDDASSPSPLFLLAEGKEEVLIFRKLA
jgi:hypothetical protein